MSQVHDYIITSYQVDFENNILVMKTQYNGDAICEQTDIVFSGYLTHIFENQMKNSILFDVVEYPLNRFMKAERELIKERKDYGWPVFTYETESDLLNYLHSNQYKAFEVSSSLGLCGWVLAKQLEIVAIKQIAT